ncbi:L-Lysine-8-amino-7-oxononanoate aminotransferase [compost metagenome]
MISLAKQLSAGYLPISALLISDTIYRALTVQSEKTGTFSHGFTYSGHPVAAAVALETLRIYEDDGIVEHVRKVMPRFQQRLAEMGEHPLVGEARGVGLLGAVELVADKSTKMPFPTEQAVAARVGEFAKQRGVITRALGDTVNFCPPLIITESQIDEMFDKVELAMDDTMSWLASVA